MAGNITAHVRNQWMGALSLFLVLAGGTAWAATELSKNEVKSKHIGKGQVKSADLGENSVTSPKVADGSLLSEDFARGQLLAGPPGEQGQRGPQGEQGVPGERGLPGESATKLFAYIKDGAAPTATANVEYGSGVTGVSDPAGHSTYSVTFNRDLSSCVVQAVSGIGNPSAGDSNAGPFHPILQVAPVGSLRNVLVDFRSPATGATTDTSIMITA